MATLPRDIIIPSNPPEVVALPKVGGPSEHVHPGQIEASIAGVDIPVLKAVQAAFYGGWNDGASIGELRANPDDEHRAAQHDRTVREKVEAAEAAFSQKLGAAETDLKAELARVTAQLDAKAGLVSVPHHFDAITSAFHAMKPGQRTETITSLIEQGDHASLAHLIEAPLFLTGLRAEERDNIKTRVLQRVDPQGLALRDHLAKSVQKVIDGSLGAIRMWANLKTGTEPGAWKIRAKDAYVKNLGNQR